MRNVTRPNGRRILFVALVLCAAWLVVQNTMLLTLFVWLGPHAAQAMVGTTFKVGSLAVALSLAILTAMAMGAALALAASRGKRWAGMHRAEVRNGR